MFFAFLDEDDLFCASAQGFYSDRADAGVEIEKGGALDPVR